MERTKFSSVRETTLPGDVFASSRAGAILAMTMTMTDLHPRARVLGIPCLAKSSRHPEKSVEGNQRRPGAS